MIRTETKDMNVIPKETRPGTLIVFEGQDGSGKTTQIAILHKLLEANGFFVVHSKWNSDPQVKPLTKTLKKNDTKIPAPVFDMLHAADLMNRYQKTIKGALEAGMIVLCDRYIYTALARGYARGLDVEHLRPMYEGFFPAPDITIHMRVPVETSLGRSIEPSDISHYEAGMDMGYSDNILESFSAFQTKVDEGYAVLAQEYDFYTFDGSLPVYEVTPMIREVISEYIDKKYAVQIA